MPDNWWPVLVANEKTVQSQSCKVNSIATYLEINQFIQRLYGATKQNSKVQSLKKNNLLSCTKGS